MYKSDRDTQTSTVVNNAPDDYSYFIKYKNWPQYSTVISHSKK